MKIAVITDNELKDELLSHGIAEHAEPVWLDKPGPVEDAIAYIDLLFTPAPDRLKELEKLQPALVIVNAMNKVLAELPAGLIRINAWPGFLKRKVVEAAGSNDRSKEEAAKVFACFNRSTEWVPDVPGFITARVVSMIINEAYFALEENVSSKEEIDTAMKLGTNYPYGPFEWGRIISLNRIYELLQCLSQTNDRYMPSSLLQKEALAG